MFVFLDILLIADEILCDITLTDAHMMFLSEEKGFTDVNKVLEAGDWRFPDVKVIIVATGRAEAVARHPALANCVNAALSSIANAYPEAVVLICTLLPYPKDNYITLKELEVLSKALNRACKGVAHFEFSKLGLNFMKKCKITDKNEGRDVIWMVRANLMDEKGLTQQGRVLAQSKIIDKFNSVRLRERCDLLKQKLVEI